MITVAVCDDNAVFAEQLNQWIQDYGREKRLEFATEVYSSAEELLADIEAGRGFELMFLDIEMKGMNGVSLGLRLRELSFQTLLVYVSGYDQYFRQLFEVEPFRFLSKPLERAMLYEVLERAAQRIGKERRQTYTFRFGKNVVNLLCRDILYLESRQRKVTVHTAHGEYEFYHKLDEVERELAAVSSLFVRIHKAYLVNLEQVEAFQYDKLALRDGTILNISEANRARVRSRFWDYLKGVENG